MSQSFNQEESHTDPYPGTIEVEARPFIIDGTAYNIPSMLAAARHYEKGTNRVVIGEEMTYRMKQCTVLGVRVERKEHQPFGVIYYIIHNITETDVELVNDSEEIIPLVCVPRSVFAKEYKLSNQQFTHYGVVL